MSAHSERPQGGQSENSSGGGVPGGDENFESGLDYGAFAEDEPDYPQDHLYPEDQLSGEPIPAADPAGVPGVPAEPDAAEEPFAAGEPDAAAEPGAAGEREQPPAETLAEHREATARQDAEVLADTPAEDETAVIGRTATLSDAGAATAPAATDTEGDAEAGTEAGTAAVRPVPAADTSATQAIPTPRPAVGGDAGQDASDAQATTAIPAADSEDKTRTLGEEAEASRAASGASGVTDTTDTTGSTAAVGTAAAGGALAGAAAGSSRADAEEPRETHGTRRGADARSGRHGRAADADQTRGAAYSLDSGESITDADLDAEANKSKRGISRFFQVLIAIFLPVIVIAVAIRAVASPAFLWIAYNRPGFPADTGGFGTGDRLLYGSYGMDYLFNAANSRYLSELAPGGEALFTGEEVTHMTDVKWVMFWTMIVAAVLFVLVLLFALLLRSWRPGGVARGVFAGAWVTIGLMIAIAVLAILDFGRFFTEFHRLLFNEGTWTFSADSTLIRLYPEQFWIDAGIGVAAVVLLLALFALIATWPTKRRRARRAARMDEVMVRRREKLVAELNKDADYSPAAR